MKLDCRKGEGLKIADELNSVYWPLMRVEIKKDGTYEDGRNAGLLGVHKHLTGKEPLDMTALVEIYTKAYDDFAGPPQFRHDVNMDNYHRAGLLGVYLKIGRSNYIGEDNV